ncbi:Transcription factor [Botryosphaeria dothidea]|uniref:Transcription factor n=1 Tax=Botryosphaeria dothidea TaxID=55169 RepID=A0A8H4N7H7_9PEZI|nr:Transcription factor [Botryosphaeria dothidea]
MLRKADGSLGDDLEQLMSCGSAWLVRQEIQADSDPIPPDALLRSSTFYVPTEPDGLPRSMFPDLTVDLMDFYTSAYFGSFNMVYPVLDREDFVTSVLPTMKTHGFAIGCLKWYYFDLNLPRTDGENLHDAIALPDFSDRKDFEGQPSIESKYQYNFLSMLSLRALMHRTFEELHDPSDEGRREGEKAHQKIIISELSHQLNTWRTLLPQDLAWDDDTRLDCNVERDAADVPPLLHVDILLAQLRCRYYYARFMIHRPFVWKVLHETSASLSQSPDILEGFIVAVDSMMHWPIAYPSVRDKKRLVPNNFVWTQSFLMFLLILRVVRDNDDVWQFCKKRVGARRIEESVDVMLDWIGDLRMVDGMARWAWRILTPIYGLAE